MTTKMLDKKTKPRQATKRAAKPVGDGKKAPAKGEKKRQRLPAAERRQQVIHAAQRVFVRQGFHGARTRDLADEAGVNEATLFLYFDSKEALFEAAVTEPLKALVKLEMRKGAAFATADTPKGKADAGTQGVQAIYKAMSTFSPLLIATLFHDPDRGTQIYRKDIYPFMRQMRAASRMSFNLEDDDEAEFIVLAAFGLCFTMHLSNQLLGKNPPAEAIASRIAGLFQHGAIKQKS